MRKAFTIIEMLVAVTLATGIIFTAFIAFRVAQSAISAGNRLASENALLRAGYAFGMREIDGWSGQQAQKPALFAPLTASDLNVIDHRPTEDWWHWRQMTTAAPPTPTGTWFSENYRMPSLSVTDANNLYQECRGFYPSTQIRENLANAMGLYGLFSYMPYHGLPISQRAWLAGDNTWGGHNYGTSGWFHDFMNATQYSPNTGGNHCTGGVIFSTAAIPDGAVAVPITDRSLRNNLLDATIRPSHWPDLQVNVIRAFSRARLISSVEVNAKSPVTDQLLTLRFRTWGTTLRGARINANVANEAAAISY